MKSYEVKIRYAHSNEASVTYNLKINGVANDTKGIIRCKKFNDIFANK